MNNGNKIIMVYKLYSFENTRESTEKFLETRKSNKKVTGHKINTLK